MEKTLNLYVMGDKPGRLDSFIAEKAKVSRTFAQKLIEDGYVIYNDIIHTKPGSRLKEGDLLFIRIPVEKAPEGIKKEDIPIEIIYEDEHIVIVNKERGMVVHPAAGHHDGTLVNALLFHVDEMENMSADETRPGIVHRLDKNTSGLLIAAKTDEAQRKLVEMFQLKKIQKEYVAIVHGRPKGREGMINLPIGRDPKDRKKMAVVPGGKPAVTRWKLVKAYKNFAVMQAFPETGRTHQIRVHMAYMGNPIAGDPEYGPAVELPSPMSGQALHAKRLTFPHPITGEMLDFQAALPEDMEELIHEIEVTE